jgi:hypothetical protein
MDKIEAKALLASELRKYRSRSYGELHARIGSQDTFDSFAPSGTRYQIEVQFFWDGQPNGNIRVMGSIDDGGWRAILPLTDSFILSWNGQFIGERAE